MAEPRKKIPITELPIRVFREIGGDDYLAFIGSERVNFTCLSDSAMNAKKKMKAFVQAEHDKLTKRKTPEVEE